MSIQDQINKILWNKRLLFIPEDIEKPEGLEYVVFKDMTLEDRNKFLFMKELEEKRAIRDGMSTEEEIMVIAREKGHWTEDDDDVEARADEYIEGLEKEFERMSKFKSRQNIISLQIRDAKAKKDSVEKKRGTLKQQTAEYYAHEVASYALLREVVLDEGGKPLLADDATFMFLKENYTFLMFYLIYEMMAEGAIDTAEIRKIARSTEWRLTWCLCREDLQTLFGRTVGDLNINQKMLIYWSRLYDSAYESTEPPEQEIIEDDDLFDNWLSERNLSNNSKSATYGDHQEQGQVVTGEYIEKCTCGAASHNKGKGLGERILHEDDCLFGTWRDFTPEEQAQRANAIYSRNSKKVRRLIDAEHEQIANKGTIEEQHLRGKKTRTMLGMPTKIIAKK